MKLVVLNDRPRRVTAHILFPAHHPDYGVPWTLCGLNGSPVPTFVDHGQELYLCGNCEGALEKRIKNEPPARDWQRLKL